MRVSVYCPAWLLLILAAVVPEALGDTIVLLGGTRIEGTIVKETASDVFVDIEFDIVRIPRAEIRKKKRI